MHVVDNIDETIAWLDNLKTEIFAASDPKGYGESSAIVSMLKTKAETALRGIAQADEIDYVNEFVDSIVEGIAGTNFIEFHGVFNIEEDDLKDSDIEVNTTDLTQDDVQRWVEAPLIGDGSDPASGKRLIASADRTTSDMGPIRAITKTDTEGIRKVMVPRLWMIIQKEKRAKLARRIAKFTQIMRSAPINVEAWAKVVLDAWGDWLAWYIPSVVSDKIGVALKFNPQK